MSYIFRHIDEAQFKQYYQAYSPLVYTVCLQITKDSECAKDCVQDIFKSVWERKVELEINTCPRNYFLRAAKLKSLEYIRNEMLAREKKKQVCHMESIQMTNDSILEHIYSNELINEYKSLLRLLPNKTKRIFLLHRKEELSYKGIADKLTISIKSVEYHISKALLFFRKNLKNN